MLSQLKQYYWKSGKWMIPRGNSACWNWSCRKKTKSKCWIISRNLKLKIPNWREWQWQKTTPMKSSRPLRINNVRSSAVQKRDIMRHMIRCWQNINHEDQCFKRTSILCWIKGLRYTSGSIEWIKTQNQRIVAEFKFPKVFKNNESDIPEKNKQIITTQIQDKMTNSFTLQECKMRGSVMAAYTTSSGQKTLFRCR